ncbi:MAG: tetratricopeptide repeat protein, partial [Bacteroidota bacterium]
MVSQKGLVKKYMSKCLFSLFISQFLAFGAYTQVAADSIESHLQNAEYYLDQSQPALALEYYQKAKRHAEHQNQQVSIARKIGIAYAISGNCEKALEFFHRCAKFHQNNGNRLKYSKCLNNLGNCYSETGEHDKAIIYYRKALEIRKELCVEPGQLYRNLGDEFFFLSQPDSGHFYLEMALKHATDPETKAAIWNNLAAGYLD